MYWEVMCRAATSGCRLLDFGRSKLGTGSAVIDAWKRLPLPLTMRSEPILCAGSAEL
jgi:hypothetical protein